MGSLPLLVRQGRKTNNIPIVNKADDTKKAENAEKHLFSKSNGEDTKKSILPETKEPNQSKERKKVIQPETKEFVQAKERRKITLPETKELIQSTDVASEFCLFLFKQVQRVISEKEVIVGIECKYCSTKKSTGETFQLFPTSSRRLRTSCLQLLFDHFTKRCKHVPSEIVSKLIKLKINETSDYINIRVSNVDYFFESLWARIQNCSTCRNKSLIKKEAVAEKKITNRVKKDATAISGKKIVQSCDK